MIDPTYKEWQTARDRICAQIAGEGLGIYAPGRIITAVLGPCPPEPVPESWHDPSGKLNVASRIAGRITVTIAEPRQLLAVAVLDADEAEAMVGALNEHIDYLRGCDPPLKYGKLV